MPLTSCLLENASQMSDHCLNHSAFDYAFNATLGMEGVYSDDEDDRGGRTKYGIIEAVFKSAIRRGLIRPVKADIRDLSVEDAKTIYRAEYWDKLRLDEVSDITIAAEIFDTAVNMGVNAATLICQRALNYLGESLDEDGRMGPRTLNALNRWSQKDRRALFVCLNGFQFQRYVAIVEGDKSQRKFVRGWTKRVQSYQT